jgi:hypothetical protein
MLKPTQIGQSPREHFMSAADDEFSEFERKEREFRRKDKEERAAKLGLPVYLREGSIPRDTRT